MADRMSMASSLEVRAPFCDHRIIEESLRLSPRVKMPGGRLKGLLKAAFAGVLPNEVLAHRKQGFMIPLGEWLRRDLRPTLDDLLAPDCVRARGLFEAGAGEILNGRHPGGAGPPARRRGAPAHRRSAGPGLCPSARRLRGGRRRTPEARAPERRAHSRRSALDAD